MVRSRILLSAILATLGVALAGCAPDPTPLSRGYYGDAYERVSIAATLAPGTLAPGVGVAIVSAPCISGRGDQAKLGRWSARRGSGASRAA